MNEFFINDEKSKGRKIIDLETTTLIRITSNNDLIVCRCRHILHSRIRIILTGTISTTFKNVENRRRRHQDIRMVTLCRTDTVLNLLITVRNRHIISRGVHRLRTRHSMVLVVRNSTVGIE